MFLEVAKGHFLSKGWGVCWADDPINVHLHSEKGTLDIGHLLWDDCRSKSDLQLNGYWRCQRKQFLAKNSCI